MRYLFVIQGEGRGHMTQAITLAGLLRSNGHQVVEVLVGECSNRQLPQFFVDKIDAPIVRYKSPALDYGHGGKHGKMWRSIMSNSKPTRSIKWLGSMNTIARRIRIAKPDVVVNFYELLMGVTSMFHRIKPPVVSIAHQFMLEHPRYGHKASSSQAQLMMSAMNTFCSFGSKKILALSLYPLPQAHTRLHRQPIIVVPPLLRPEIFKLNATKGDYILGYMLNPAFLDEILEWKRTRPDVKIHLFWDKAGEPELQEVVEGLWLHRINDQLFIEKMASSAGYITTAGFESVCEAYYMDKAVMMIPAHIEQQINARDAASAGVGVVSDTFDIAALAEYIPNHTTNNEEFKEWVHSAESIFLSELTKVK
ncbi:MAG: glycosyltransferase family protein [Rikenellaceae bacterium]